MPIKVKLYDFEYYSHQSFALDLILFLFTSVRCDVLAANFKIFIDTHHLEFRKTLEMANIPLDNFTHDKYVVVIIII